MKPPPEERKATSIGCCAAIFAVYLVSREGGRRRCAQTLLDKGLATVSRMGLSIGAMMGFWVTAWAGAQLFVMLAVERYMKRRWPSRSGLGLGALVGLSAILLAFVGIGALIEGALHGAEWLRDDEMALGTGILCLFAVFVLGVLRAMPWVLAQREWG